MSAGKYFNGFEQKLEQIKKGVASPNIIIPFIILKVVTYYCLIDVNVASRKNMVNALFAEDQIR